MRGLVVCVVLSTGCLVPPMRIGAGGGGAGGGIVTVDRTGHPYDHSAALLGELRAGFTPLALMDTPPESWDLDLGCAFDYTAARSGAQRHDEAVLPYVEGAWFPHIVPTSPQIWRVGPTFEAELPIALHEPTDGGGAGFGVSAGVLAELVEHRDNRMFAGYEKGYWGLGVAARAGMREVAGETYGFVLVTIEARVPFMAGVPIPGPSRRRGLND